MSKYTGKVIVMMGGPSSEHEVSLASGKMVYEALKSSGIPVQALTISPTGKWALMESPVEGPLKPGRDLPLTVSREEALKGVQLLDEVDVVFLAFHGAFGEDGTLQGLLEALGIAYTGSGPLASALAMNKRKAKELFRYHAIPVPKDFLVDSYALRHAMENRVQAIERHLNYPLVVKPNTGGSSVGVSLAHNRFELHTALSEAIRFDADVLIEEFVRGREVTCAVLENIDGSLNPLPVIEILPKRGTFFDFSSKYEDAGADEICPAQLTEGETETVQQVAMQAHQVLGCEGFSRADMILTDSGPVLLEVNTIPGMTPNSLLPKAARAAGIPFGDLMEHLVKLAALRFQRQKER